MKARMISWLVLSTCPWFSPVAFAGDSSCYGNTSTTSHFACNIPPANSGNCVWWAVFKRPDLAAKIDASGTSGWNGGQWYDKFNALGVAVGSIPKLGSIVEFSNPGHVAYVEKVNSDESLDVSEMDAYSSNGFVDGVNYATYYPNGNGAYHRNGGSQAWILKGFIYPRGISSESDNTCDPTKEKCDIRINGDVGWFPPVDICQSASQWFIVGTDSNGEKYVMGSRPNASACPMMCVPN